MLTQGGTKNIIDNMEILKKLPTNTHTQVLLGGGINHENIKFLLEELHPKEVHIGTCVREPKYGPVSKDKLIGFR